MYDFFGTKRFLNSNKSSLKHLSNGLSCQDSDVSSTEIDEILDGIFKVNLFILLCFQNVKLYFCQFEELSITIGCRSEKRVSYFSGLIRSKLTVKVDGPEKIRLRYAKQSLYEISKWGVLWPKWRPTALNPLFSLS